MTRALILCLLLGACAGVRTPGVGIYRGAGGQVTSSVSSGVGPVSVGVNNRGGGYLGTRLGPISLGAGF